MNESDLVFLTHQRLDTSDLDTSSHGHHTSTDHDIQRRSQREHRSGRHQRRSRQGPPVSSSNAVASSLISELAPETLARIFAFLDPTSISRCAQTCRAWHTIVSLDTTWRAAFMVASGLEEREDAIVAHKHVASHDPTWAALRVAPTLRRMESNWRAEYTARTALLRRWRKSRTPTVLTDPRIATVDKLALSASRRFALSLSNEFSVASRSNALTGKVAKDFLDASGFASRGANGYPNIEFTPAATAHATDAFASRIVWGLHSGDLALTTIDWRGQSARGTIHNRSFPPGNAHQSPVTAIGMPFAPGHGGAHTDERYRHHLSTLGDLATTFVSAAADGSVMLWHPKHMSPLWTGSARPLERSQAADSIAEATPARPAVPLTLGAHQITHLEYAPTRGIVVAARVDGSLVVWQGIPVRELLHLYESLSRRTSTISLSSTVSRSPTATAASWHSDLNKLWAQAWRTDVPSAQPGTQIEHLVLDASSMPGVSMLVHYRNARVFLRVDVNGAGHQTTVFGTPGVSTLTSLRCDFDVRVKPPALPPVMLARMHAGRLHEHKFVCAGTASGRIGVWEWDAHGEPYDASAQRAWQAMDPIAATRQVRPAHVFEGHHNAITALAFTPALVILGCEDGTIKAIDTLSGALVRVFNERTARRHPARMLAAGELTVDEAARFRVNHIVACDDMFVAAVGMHVLSWHTDKEETPSATTSSSASDSTARATSKRQAKSGVPERVRLKADIEQAVEEGQHQVRLERERLASSQARRAALTSSVHGTLDEDTALDYALMLSREEAQPPLEDVTTSAAAEDDLPAELMYDMDLHNIQDGDSDATPISPSLTASDSVLAPSRAWDILCTAGHSATTTSGDTQPSGSWSKLQTVAVPRHARVQAGASPHSGASPDVAGVYGSFSSVSSYSSGTPIRSDVMNDWPEMRSDHGASRTSSRSPHSLGAWAIRSPTLRAVDSSSAQNARRAGRSALVDRPSPAEGPSPALSATESIDDDLRLALELSLAEYESAHQAHGPQH